MTNPSLPSGVSDTPAEVIRSDRPRRRKPSPLPVAGHRPVFAWLVLTLVSLGFFFIFGFLAGYGYLMKLGPLADIDLPWLDRLAPAPQPAPPAQSPPSPPLMAAGGPESTILARLPGRKSLVLISDFGWGGPPFDAVAEAARLDSQYGFLNIYSIGFGQSEEALKRAEALALAGGCGKYYDGLTLMSDAKTFQGMLDDIFYASRQDQDLDGVCDPRDKCPDTPLGVEVDPLGCPKTKTFTLEIEFDPGKAVIKPEHEAMILQVADFLAANPGAKARIEGHTDSSGHADANVRLSRERAESVREFLIRKFGLAADRLTAEGFGASRPLASNDTPEGRRLNRRVDVVVTGPDDRLP